MIKFYFLWTTRAVEDNLSVLSLDMNPVRSSLNSLTVRAHLTYGTSCSLENNLVINANSYFSLSFTASLSPSLLKAPNDVKLAFSKFCKERNCATLRFLWRIRT